MEEEGRRWEDLEADCLLNIFGKLSLDDLALGVPLVCRSWHRASHDPLCWRILDFRSSDHNKLIASSFSGFLKLAVSRGCNRAEELRFPQDASSIRDIELASIECPRLRAVALPNMAPEEERRLPRLVGRWRDLERLEMDLKPSCFPELMRQVGASCAGFRELAMCGSIRRGDALAIVNLAPRIRCLDLSRSHLPVDELLVIMKGCREMERLSVNFCVGFQADEHLLAMASSSIRVFEHEGSRLWDCYLHTRI